MKKLFSLVLLSAMAQSAWAANGSLLIGISPNSTAMGGTGVSNSTNVTDAIYKNPALLGAQKFGDGKLNLELSGSVFKQGPNANVGAGAFDTKSGVEVMPNIAAAFPINSSWTFGVGIYSYGGGVADFSGLTTSGLQGIKTKHQLNKLQPTISYNATDWLKVGLAPFLNYNQLTTNEALLGTQTTRNANGQFGAGLQAGAAIKLPAGFDLGLSYTSKSTMTFENIINLSLLTATPNPTGGLDKLVVDQPTEFAVGLGYSVFENWRLAFDYRFIAWQGAGGYRDLGWIDQNVLALGTELKLNKLAMRAGINYAKSPIASDVNRNPAGFTPFQDVSMKNSSLDLLNLVAFPALAEWHFTLGAGYAIADNFDIDLAFMYAPTSSATRSGPNGVGYSFTTSVVQWSTSLGATYRF